MWAVRQGTGNANGAAAAAVYSEQNVETTETVFITSSSNVKYIEVPTSDDPLLTWMEVRKGKFPNVTKDLTSVTNVTVGDPITLFIFFKDNSNILYDIKVTDCWAYDNKEFLSSKRKLHLNGNKSYSKNKQLIKWRKGNSSREIPSFLYTSFTSFKFPDKDEIYLSCDIQASFIII
ncbi:hypothetical protein NQ314_016146 [Rhamnusium bicolor]|uniref:ZP domain-containing protein n=1 Tax=Rhamnusium bicolor TaxID=1586634 RepID=A0AAV8WWY6_9CUCU|nr:hypothetical protein NQ314_016146 [Rhamnusium bicolor]